MATASILGQYEKSLNQQAGTDRVATDKDTFLKLLVAQLTHQDPLNPVEDKEFIAQLAQFTSVEELQKLNTGMEQLNASYLDSQITSAASLIGMDVIAGGYNIKLSGAENFKGTDDYPAIYATPPRDMSKVVMTVYAAKADGSTGAIVYSAEMTGSWSAGGLHTFAWPGTNSAGTPMPDGNYNISILGYDADGKEMMVETSSGGIVIGVETSPDGNHKLYLADGRTVNYSEVALITVPRQVAPPEDDGNEDGEGEGDGDGNGEGDGSSSGSGESESGGTEAGTESSGA